MIRSRCAGADERTDDSLKSRGFCGRYLPYSSIGHGVRDEGTLPFPSSIDGLTFCRAAQKFLLLLPPVIPDQMEQKQRSLRGKYNRTVDHPAPGPALQFPGDWLKLIICKCDFLFRKCLHAYLENSKSKMESSLLIYKRQKMLINTLTAIYEIPHMLLTCPGRPLQRISQFLYKSILFL